MNCMYDVCGIFLETSDSECIGLMCAMLDTFGTDLPFDVEISSFKTKDVDIGFEDFSWTLISKLQQIKNLQEQLKTKNGDKKY